MFTYAHGVQIIQSSSPSLWDILYFTALSTIPLMKYFCRNRKHTTTGRIASRAPAEAAFRLLVVCEKKDEIPSVTVLIFEDCRI